MQFCFVFALKTIVSHLLTETNGKTLYSKIEENKCCHADKTEHFCSKFFAMFTTNTSLYLMLADAPLPDGPPPHSHVMLQLSIRKNQG